MDKFSAGTPLKTPLLKVIPSGNSGSNSHVSGLPPSRTGDTLRMSWPLVRVNCVVVYEILAAGSSILILMRILAEPPVLLAKISYVASEEFTFGTPVIVPLPKIRPSGKSGYTSQVATMPPVLLSVKFISVSLLVNSK